MPVDDVRVGDIIIVKPGEKIPLDGRVHDGISHVNQAPVTGESLPAEKMRGDEVFAGTINGRGALEVDGDAPAAAIPRSRESSISSRRRRRSARRARRSSTGSRASTRRPCSCWPSSWPSSRRRCFGADWGTWIYRSLVLLVISCPCALVISTPVSIVSALAAAARKGVLIKGGARLERLASVRCVAFDKTGTLTRGRLRVTDIVPLNGAHPSRCPRAGGIARVTIRTSDRPRDPRRAPNADALTLSPVDGLPALCRGAAPRARSRASPVVVGSHRLFEERGCAAPDAESVLDRAGSCRAGPASWSAVNGEAVGVIGVADEIRESAADTVQMLRAQGVEHVVMLTGDHESAARGARRVDRRRRLPRRAAAGATRLAAVARAAAQVRCAGHGGRRCQRRSSACRRRRRHGHGRRRSDAALETADIALMADELPKIPYARRLSRATTRNIRANVSFSLVLKAAFLVMAIAGTATLWMAVVADMGASLIVIANALRLLTGIKVRSIVRTFHALRLEKKCWSTNSSMAAWSAGSTFSNCRPIPTRRSLHAIRDSASMSRFEPGRRNRARTFDPFSQRAHRPDRDARPCSGSTSARRRSCCRNDTRPECRGPPAGCRGD